jgi:subtilisin family serine protease
VERSRIAAVQQQVRKELAARKITVTGSVNTTLNALFVTAPESRVNEMKSIPGVLAVQPQRTYRLHLNEATQLMNAPAAWSLVGGMGNARKGIKIGIIDTGVEASHPAFQDPSQPMPPGYPFCASSDCQFTNNKIIVARSYVRLLTAEDSSSSTPDDYSARDRVGHGTASASCTAANVTTSGSITFSGMAPKAYIGSYKVFGSPGVNEGASDEAIMSALEDALYDGMDIVNLSLGSTAITGPLDTGAACGNPDGVPCDANVAAVENATKLGMIVVASAGNEGDEGLATVGTPGSALSAITVGASTNAHTFQTTVSANDPSAPPGLKGIPTRSAFSPAPAGAVTGSLIDVTQLGDDGLRARLCQRGH